MTVRSLLAILLAAGFVALALPAFAGAPSVAVRCTPTSLQADESGMWTFTVTLHNTGSVGAYGDSAVLEVTPEGASGPRSQKLFLPAAATALSAGDSLESQVSVVASAQRAQLVFRYFVHSGDGTPGSASAAATAVGSVLEDRYPATRLAAGGRTTEIVRVPAAEGTATGGALLVLAAEDADARDLLVPAARLAAQGVHVVIVNAPGRGGSQGTGGADGADARKAALAALDTLLAMPGVDRTQVGAWGVSLGGTLALRLAAEKPAAFRVVVAQAARYDALPPRTAAALKATVLLVHGERDAVFPAAQAHAFAAAAKAAGGTVITRFLPAGQHALPALEATRFLQSRLAAAP